MVNNPIVKVNLESNNIRSISSELPTKGTKSLRKPKPKEARWFIRRKRRQKFKSKGSTKSILS